jgi:hypothetical protein
MNKSEIQMTQLQIILLHRFNAPKALVTGLARFVTANVTDQIAKIARVYRACHGVTGKNPWRGRYRGRAARQGRLGLLTAPTQES